MSDQPNFAFAVKQRHERIRWFLLRALHVSRPDGAYLHPLLDVVRSVYHDATEQEIKRELTYLQDRHLVELKVDPTVTWYAKLCRHGVDLVEYTIDCEPGIARPAFGI